MRNRFYYSVLVMLALFLVSCGENHHFKPPEGDPELKFGTAESFDIITWNLQNFPITENTVDLLAEIIPQMEVEIFAFQEIMEPEALHSLAAKLPHHEATCMRW